MHHHTVDLSRPFSDQYFLSLMSPYDIARDFVPNDRVHVAVVIEAALDLFIGRVTRLQVLARVVFRGFELLNGNPLQVHLGIQKKPPSLKSFRRQLPVMSSCFLLFWPGPHPLNMSETHAIEWRGLQ